MYVEWTQHLADPKEREEFVNTLTSSKRVLSRLKAIVENREKSIESYEMSVKSFDNPSWAYKQAFNNGLKSAFNIVKKYIDLDQQKEVNESTG